MPDTPQEQPKAAQEAPKDQPQQFDADYVAQLRQEAANYRTQAKANADAAKKLAAIEEANKSEAQKAADALAAAQKEAAQAKADAMKLRVGAAKGLPADLIGRLQGATEEELAADADALLALLRPATQPVGAPTPAPVSGAVPPPEQGATDLNAWMRDQLTRR